MESRNDLFSDKQLYTKVVRMENAMSPFFVFGSVLGNQGGAMDEMFEPVGQGIGAEWIKMLEESDFYEPMRVLDRSRVPDRLVAGKNFEITLDRADGDPDETLMTRDEETLFRVESRRAGTLGADYTLQYIGLPGTSVPGAYFHVNDPIFAGYGNSKGHGSTTSNQFVDDSTKQTTFFNLSNVQRYGLTEQGGAMADEVYKFAVTEGMDGSKTTNEFRTDMPVKFMRKLLHAADHALMYNTPNFDPRTKTIANRSAMGRSHERPYYAGLYWQLDQCPWKFTHYKSASSDEGVQKLDFIMQYFFNKMGGKQTLFAMCQGAGAEWLRATILTGGLNKYKVNLFQTVTGGDKLKIGFEAEEYITSHGRLVIYDIGQAMSKWGAEFDRTSYNGVSYRKRTNDIYFIPGAVKGDGGRTKKPAHIYYKEGNGISRGFAFGYMKGITGEQGFSADQLMNMQDEFVRRNASNQRFRLDSAVDGREFHVLMQHVPYLDARNVARLRLQ